MINRKDHPVFVAESDTLGSIGVIRSLGRTGYPVIACSPQPDALGFRSAFTTEAHVCPPYSDSEKLASWLRDKVRKIGVRCIIPSEGMLLSLKPHFQEFKSLMPLHQNADVVYRGMSKFDLFDSFTGDSAADSLKANSPRCILVDENSPAIDSQALSGMRYPLFVKTDGIYSFKMEPGNVSVCETPPVAVISIERLRRHFRKLIIQEFSPGIGVGVFLLRWNGNIKARFMHKRLHEVPHTGGTSSLRQSWWYDKIYEDAVARVEHLDWQGVGMLEYRWDEKSNNFRLMELNGRFWGSLHLALNAGVDFPRLLVDAFWGHEETCMEPRQGMRCRLTFPKEVEYVWSCLKDSSLPFSKRCWPIVEFFLLGLNPWVKSDMLFPGDRKLYIPMFVRSIRGFFK